MSSFNEHELERLLGTIYQRFHYDFRSYAMASLKRRVTGAMRALRCETVSDLEARLEADPAAFGELLQFLTVQVSDMFRDPPFFRAFRDRIVPELRTYPSLRLWVAGCSTGEEAYSFAILLREEGLLERTTIYATDINPHALAKAESGVYAVNRIPTFTANHMAAGGKQPLGDYYHAAYAGAAMDKSLRKHIVFADHSLATDNVFAEMQAISCRNVLIYFDRPLQKRAIALFADSLCRRGYLGLGARETLKFNPHADAFEELLAEERWYRRC